MTKAEQIRDLIDGELTNWEIAEQLDCDINYARAVRGRYLRPHVYKNWNDARAERLGCAPTTQRYRTSPEFRARHRETVRRYRQRQKQQAA